MISKENTWNIIVNCKLAFKKTTKLFDQYKIIEYDTFMNI